MRSLRHDVMMKVVARDDRGLRDVIASHNLDCDFTVLGRHVLSVACASSSVEVVRELLAGGAPVTCPSGAEWRPQRDDPLLVVVRLNREDVFEELLKKARKVTCVVPWTCLTERRYAMLDALLRRGMCHDFVESMTSHFWGAPHCRFLRKYLPVLVTSNVLLDKWKIATHHASPIAAALPLSAVPLLLAAKAQLPRKKISSTETNVAVRFLYSPQPLQDLARSVIRTYLVHKKLYEKLTNIFCSVVGQDQDAELPTEDSDRTLEYTVRKFNCLPRQVLDILFLVKEKREFEESVKFGSNLPSIRLSFVGDK